jgi:hypothetical protein
MRRSARYIKTALVIFLVLNFLSLTPAHAEVKDGDTCTTAKQVISQNKEVFECVAIGNQLIWKNPQTSSANAAATATYVYPKLTQKNNPGFILNKGAKTKIDIWEDFQCPNCAKFETINAKNLSNLLKDPNFQITFHILGFIGLESQLAANAAGCASDENKFIDFHNMLFRKQAPTRNSGVWTNDQLVKLGKSLNLKSAKFTNCINSIHYFSWVNKLSDSAKLSGITATPSVFINGVAINRTTDYFDANRFKAITLDPTLIVSAPSTSTASPTPTPIKLSFEVSKVLGVEPTISQPVGLPPALLFVSDIVTGTGATITKNENVTVNYVVMNWYSGKILQSTWATGFRVVDSSKTITGWQKGLIGMREGGRRLIICPPDWAYGAKGTSKIEPNSTLIYVVDLQKIGNS